MIMTRRLSGRRSSRRSEQQEQLRIHREVIDQVSLVEDGVVFIFILIVTITDLVIKKKVKHQLWPLDRKIRVIEQVVAKIMSP